jgi:hypothetical protein
MVIVRLDVGVATGLRSSGTLAIVTDGPGETDEPAHEDESAQTGEPVNVDESGHIDESGGVVRPASPPSGSSWSVDWRGAAVVVVLGVIALVAWRWIDDVSVGSGDSEPADVASSSTVETAAPTTTVRRTTTTSSTSTSTSTTTIDPGPRVDIVGEVKPCRFGDDCLVASFSVSGFDDAPDRYECIYPNSRSEFGFDDDGKDDACFSGDEGDTIAIEVDGVVSKTISAENLDGE